MRQERLTKLGLASIHINLSLGLDFERTAIQQHIFMNTCRSGKLPQPHGQSGLASLPASGGDLQRVPD
jgi:hypothetical protein